MEELRENYEHLLTWCENLHLDICVTSEKGKGLSDVEKNVCKFVVIKSDWSGLKISMFILPTEPRGQLQIVNLNKKKILTDKL